MNDQIRTGPAQTGGRISFPAPAEMTAAQREVYDQIVSGPRGVLVGPLRAALHNPVLADRWQRLGQVLRFETSIPARLNELAILVTARRWNSDLEWTIHERDAARAGLDPRFAAAIRSGGAPDFGEDAAAGSPRCRGSRMPPRARSMNTPASCRRMAMSPMPSMTPSWTAGARSAWSN